MAQMRYQVFFANGDISTQSIPDVLFIEFDAVTVQKFAILFLERLDAVMFFLGIDVRYDAFSMRGAYGEYTVPTLPKKLIKVGPECFDEF